MIGFALAGRATAGKSSLGAEFEALGFERHAFGDALKAEVLERYGLAKDDPGGREALIEWGDTRRAEDPLYWINQLERTIAGKVGRVPLVIDDLRFVTEADWCRRHGFMLVRIHASVSCRRARLSAKGHDPDFAMSTTITETDLDAWKAWDGEVWNERDAMLTHEAIALLAAMTARSRASVEAA